MITRVIVGGVAPFGELPEVWKPTYRNRRGVNGLFILVRKQGVPHPPPRSKNFHNPLDLHRVTPRLPWDKGTLLCVVRFKRYLRNICFRGKGDFLFPTDKLKKLSSMTENKIGHKGRFEWGRVVFPGTTDRFYYRFVFWAG